MSTPTLPLNSSMRKRAKVACGLLVGESELCPHSQPLTLLLTPETQKRAELAFSQGQGTMEEEMEGTQQAHGLQRLPALTHGTSGRRPRTDNGEIRAG